MTFLKALDKVLSENREMVLRYTVGSYSHVVRFKMMPVGGFHEGDKKKPVMALHRKEDQMNWTTTFCLVDGYTGSTDWKLAKLAD